MKNFHHLIKRNKAKHKALKNFNSKYSIMNFSKLTLTSFLAQAVFFSFNLVGTNTALCTASTVVEQKEEGSSQGGNSSLRGNKEVRSTNRILSSDDDENRFLVKFKGHDQFMAADMKLQSDPHQIMSLPDDDVEVMTFASEEELRYWEEREDVEYVEPDHKVYRLGETIPDHKVSWWLETIPDGIKSVKALDVSDGSVSNQKVCIIDTGYDINHPDLQSSRSIVTGHSQVGSSWTKDGHGHGTHVAGTIAALGGNNQGVVGVNRNGELKLHIVKIFGDDGTSTRTSDLIRAVENCAAAGATVVNMSLGSDFYSQAKNDAMARIFNQGVLLVAAAGNNGSSSKSYPASYPSVMSVAAVDSSNRKAEFSQYNDQVDIAAPGVGVLSTLPGGRYARYSGTSMASPHVAGVAALVWSHFPNKTAKQIRQALESTAKDLGSRGRDDKYGHGLVRADLAYNHLIGKFGEGFSKKFVLINPKTGKALHVDKGSCNDGANIKLLTRNNLGAQVFRYHYASKAIVNVKCNKAVDISGAICINGANIQLWRRNGTGAQKFRFMSDGRIENVGCGGKSIDIQGWQSHNGANIHSWSKHSDWNQKWRIVYI